jgi:threonine synthase
MNIQVASNFERLIFDASKPFKLEGKIASAMHEFERTNTLKLDQSIHQHIKQDFTAYQVSDEQTLQTIAQIFTQTGEILDPHTAIGIEATNQFIASKNYQQEPVITLATAHPAKFPDAVLQAKLTQPQLPNFLQNLFDLPEKYQVINNNIEEVKTYINSQI